ncbi:MAG: hypothetical protein WKF80_04875 [Thermomicrobiales bacterium]
MIASVAEWVERKRSGGHLTGADLVALDGGYLTGHRLARVEGHYWGCRACQERMAADREVDRLVRRAMPPVTIDPALKAALLTRVAEEWRQPTSSPPSRPRRPVLALTMVVLAGILVVARPGDSGANDPLGSFIQVGAVEIKGWIDDPQPLAVPVNATPDTGDVAFAAVEPATLPLGYRVVDREVTDAGGLDLYLENEAGASLLLTQGPPSLGGVVVEPDARNQVVRIRDVNVLAMGDPRDVMTGAMFWEREGIVFALIVATEPSGGFPLAHGLAVIEAIIAVQDEEEAS